MWITILHINNVHNIVQQLFFNNKKRKWSKRWAQFDRLDQFSQGSWGDIESTGGIGNSHSLKVLFHRLNKLQREKKCTFTRKRSGGHNLPRSSHLTISKQETNWQSGSLMWYSRKYTPSTCYAGQNVPWFFTWRFWFLHTTYWRLILR